MWSTAVSFEVDTQDFPVSEDMLPRRRQDTDEVSLICGGALQYSIVLGKIISMNTGWVNPWLKALVRGLASLSAWAVDLSGCQVARVKSTRVWSLIYFLNIFNDYSTIEEFVSA